MTTSHNTRQHFAFSHAHSGTDEPEVTVIYTGQNLKSNAFRLGLKKIYFSIGLDNGKRKKHIFCSCLEWRTNYLWLWIQTSDPSRFDFSAFVILFLSSYFEVSKWWPIPEWNKSYFFPLVNFDSSWTAGAKLLLSGLEKTLFNALHTCDVSHHVTWIAPFSKWPSIKPQKKFVKNFILHVISLICSFRIL